MPDVTQGVSSVLFHPTLGTLIPHLDGAGPHTGNVTLTQFSRTLGPTYSWIPVQHTYGLLLQVVSVPPAWGYAKGYIDPLGNGAGEVFYNRFAQICVQHQLRQAGDLLVPTGAWVTTQRLELRTFPEIMLWETALPGRIGIYTAPGIEIDLYYLEILESS